MCGEGVRKMVRISGTCLNEYVTLYRLDLACFENLITNQGPSIRSIDIYCIHLKRFSINL